MKVDRDQRDQVLFANIMFIMSEKYWRTFGTSDFKEFTFFFLVQIFPFAVCLIIHRDVCKRLDNTIEMPVVHAYTCLFEPILYCQASMDTFDVFEECVYVGVCVYLCARVSVCVCMYDWMYRYVFLYVWERLCFYMYECLCVLWVCIVLRLIY
jgi:hypothetical protein